METVTKKSKTDFVVKYKPKENKIPAYLNVKKYIIKNDNPNGKKEDLSSNIDKLLYRK